MRTIGTIIHLKSVVLALLLILAYFGVWRQVRVVLISEYIFPLVERINTEETGLRINAHERPAITIKDNQKSGYHEFSGFGNSFLLFGSLYFIFAGIGWRPILNLSLLHFGITFLSLGCLLLAVGVNSAWLYPMKLLVTYITPAATGMFVLMQKREAPGA
jgi:hypothetical protein